MMLRDVLGEVLRDIRTSQNMTLRDVQENSTVTIGYISEIERGRKEASSEVLASICSGLYVTLGTVMRMVTERLEIRELDERKEAAVRWQAARKVAYK